MPWYCGRNYPAIFDPPCLAKAALPLAGRPAQTNLFLLIQAPRRAQVLQKRGHKQRLRKA